MGVYVRTYVIERVLTSSESASICSETVGVFSRRTREREVCGLDDDAACWCRHEGVIDEAMYVGGDGVVAVTCAWNE